ncbi:hypothetical protein KL905_003534 [Ogataea polymorpha]|nr:hypothetical protein KL905_003534 [Ogataea polymorpha]
MDPEYKALTSVFSAHKSYKSWAVKQVVAPKKLKYRSLTKEEQAFFPWMDQHIRYLEHSVDLNAQFLEQIAMTVAPIWGSEPEPGVWAECSAQDLDKVRSILVQFAREWSAECAEERASSFGRILQECENLFPDVVNRQNVEVLVPGSGLGRLVVEFVRRGFRTQGNEFSYHMLTNSSFIVNHSLCENNFVICPYLHKSSNVSKRTDQIRQVYIPDFNPGDISLINKEYPEIPRRVHERSPGRRVSPAKLQEVPSGCNMFFSRHLVEYCRIPAVRAPLSGRRRVLGQLWSAFVALRGRRDCHHEHTEKRKRRLGAGRNASERIGAISRRPDRPCAESWIRVCKEGVRH